MSVLIKAFLGISAWARNDSRSWGRGCAPAKNGNSWMSTAAETLVLGFFREKC